jgi:predicted GNAT family acetyltransferase
MDTSITLDVDDHGEGRYTLLIDGQPAGELDFRAQEGRRVVTHTGIRVEYQRQGLAGTLARRMLDDARNQQLLVVPLCSFVADYIDTHPDDRDLVDRDLTARLGS